MNYILSFCKITAASKIFSRNFYLPLLKPQSPKDALRTFKITGKWLVGAKRQHYIPVLLNHKQNKKRSKRSKNDPKIEHVPDDNYVYVMPILDTDNNDNHKLLYDILSSKANQGAFVYTVDDKNYNLVVAAAFESAIRDGEIIDVLISQRCDKIVVKLKDMRKVPVEIVGYDGEEELFRGEGATTAEEEKNHHHGKYTMSLAKIFEDKEKRHEEWELELQKLLKRKRRQDGEGTKEWNDMMEASTANMDWQRFEKEAKKIVEHIEEPVVELHIGMEVTDFDKTKDAIRILNSPTCLDQLPTLRDIPDIVQNLSSAVFHEIQTDARRLSGVKVTLPSGKECFVTGQMVKTDQGDVFVPGQTVENQFGVEYAPGFTVFMDNKPTLIAGLIVGNGNHEGPMFVPTESSITGEGQLMFSQTPEERVKYKPRRAPKVKKKPPVPPDTTTQNGDVLLEPVHEEEKEPVQEQPVENGNDDCNHCNDEHVFVDNVRDLIEEAEQEKHETDDRDGCDGDGDGDADPRLKEYEWELELERLRMKAIDDKIGEVIESFEMKKAQLLAKLEELRKLSLNKPGNYVTYANIEETHRISSALASDPEHVDALSDVLLTLVRRVFLFPDKSSIRVENINRGGAEALDETLKIVLKTAIVAANNVFKVRPKDEVAALIAIGAVLEMTLKNKDELVKELCRVMKPPADRSELCLVLLNELARTTNGNKIDALRRLVAGNDKGHEQVLEQFGYILNSDSSLLGQAFIKYAKKRPAVLLDVVKSARSDMADVESEEAARDVLQNAIIDAIKDGTDRNFKDLIKKSTTEDIEELVAESRGFSSVLGCTEVADALAADLIKTTDRACLNMLKRVTLIRDLADGDYGLRAALSEIRKNPDSGKTSPRIRQLVRESASLLASFQPIKNSRAVPSKLLDDDNALALEDFVLQKTRLMDRPVLVCKNGKQAVVPKEMSKSVLAGRTAYVLIDEDGVTDFKPLHHLFGAKKSPDYEKRLDKGHESWTDKAKVNRFDVRNRIRRLSNFNHRMKA